jgi:hypothetical protein
MSNVKTRPLTRVQAPVQRALGKPTLYRLEDVDELVWEYIRTLRIDEPQFSKPHRAELETLSSDDFIILDTIVHNRLSLNRVPA